MPQDAAQVRTRLREAGLGEYVDAIMGAARPTVAVARADRSPSGFSKFGGDPDLPPGFAWPHREKRKVIRLLTTRYPLGFLAQIDLADAARHDTTGLLPTSGRLWFFYDLKEWPWGFDPADRTGWHVHYEPKPGPTTRHAAPKGAYGDGKDDEAFAPSPIDFAPTLTFPLVDVLDLPEELADAYIKVTGAGSDDDGESGSAHRMLGHPTVIQNPMELECQLASNGINTGGGRLSPADERRAKQLEPGATDWVLLLQLASDDVWMWGDMGMLYFWIRKQDLAARDFSKVWVILQCF